MNYKIIVPIYQELPHIQANLDSINDWEHLYIIDNSKTAWCSKFVGSGADIDFQPANIGVARSWNRGIKQGAEYNFFVSSSVRFENGFKEVVDLLEKLIAEQAKGIEYGMYTQLGWHCNALSQKAIEKVGYFDENFYPAYEEDVDMCQRLYLAGLHCNKKSESLGLYMPTVSIHAKPVEIAATIKHTNLAVNFTALRKYYIEKWGGDHGLEKYATPFCSGDLGYFPKKTIQELKNEYEI